MAISFSGKHNIQVRSISKINKGMNPTDKDDFESEDNKTTNVFIAYDVNNDASGKDLDIYNKALKDSGKEDYKNQYLPNLVNFEIKIDKIGNDEITARRNTSFKLNNKPIAFETDKDLPILKYLADVTKDLSEKKPEKEQYCEGFVKDINDMILEAALEYFDK